MIILLSIIIIFAIILFIVWGRFFRVLNVKWPLFLYFFVLIAFVPVFYMISGNSHLNSVQPNETDILSYPEELKKLVIENKLESTQWFQLSDKESIEYNNNEMEIQHIENMFRVYVKKKNVDDGKILSKYYTMKTYVNNIDVTKKIMLPMIKLVNGSLTADYPVRNIIELYGFKNDFTVRQFMGGSDYNGVNISNGLGILYLEVPKKLKIKSSDPFIEYLD